MSASENRKTKTPLARVVGRAMTGTVNLVVAGTAGLAAAGMHSFSVLALGGVAYAALVAWDLANPKFVKRALDPDPISLPRPGDVRDAALRETVAKLRAAQASLEKTIAEAPENVTSGLATVIASVTAMQKHAASIAGRADALAEYLAHENEKPIEHEIQKLRIKVDTTRDAEAKSQYESALATKLEEAKALEDIGAARERIEANLTRIVAVTEALSPKIVRIAARGDEAFDDLTSNLGEELETINGDLAAFEETLKSLTEVNS